ncbi:amidophosphoribosyltransferase [Aestuariimicrobium soli]|uniref:amidophosphoribosyltransferase n=1 Tax=Aestuariimicrobium soli TaxID=2035834 RepID=UPI003EBC7D10
MPRPDGLLTHELDPHDRGPQDHCGVFGVLARDEEVAKLTFFGLYALQHRGQESAGIAVSNGERIMVFKDMGLVSQVFDEAALNSLPGHLAIGHTRYSTTGASVWNNAQPTFRPTENGGLALAHNGNLTNTDELEAVLATRMPAGQVPHKNRMDSTNDTSILTALLATHPAVERGGVGGAAGVEQAALEVLPQLTGAFCLTFMTETALFAARDPQGIRPLAIGRLSGGGWVVASETAALDIVGAEFVRDVAPGELVVITEDEGLRSLRFADQAPKHCLFEYVYLARPDTTFEGRRIHNVRVKVGKTLAKEHPVEADLVIPTPESGTPAAIGFAAESKIPYGQGLVRNAYVGRTFIQPSQTMRQMGIRLKLNPLASVVKGKRLVVVDDTIVRGNTQRQVVSMLRQAGATEVHVRISAPPVQWPCFYGIDFATREELLAPGMSVDEMCEAIGADSLGFVSLDGLVKTTHQPMENLCRACFDGVYPVRTPVDHVSGDC